MNVLLALRGQRLETFLQFELVEQSDREGAVTTTGTALTAGE
jgi:hypothetical protein